MSQVVYIDIHTHHRRTSDDLLCVQSQTEPERASEPFTAGIHPRDVNRLQTADFQPVWDDPGCIAIGECGFDRRYLTEIHQDKQQSHFRLQALEAEKRKLPLIVHDVRMYPELLRLKKALSPAVPWILHGFRGNEQKCMELICNGFILSFGDGLLRDAGNVEPYFAKIPRDRIFFETDDSETDIRQIYAIAASMMSLSINELTEIIK